MGVLRPPLKRVMHSVGTVSVGALAILQTMYALVAPVEGALELQAQSAQAALWWIAYAAVKAARIYEYKPLIPVSPVLEGKDQ